tara:strand:- start:268 stop:522 length:255 start_codon:yes stop_codon:yes gene_type:complete
MKVKILQDCNFNVGGKKVSYKKGDVIRCTKELTGVGQATFVMGYAEIIEEPKPTKKRLVQENKAMDTSGIENKAATVKPKPRKA